METQLPQRSTPQSDCEITILAALRQPGTTGWHGAFVAVEGEGKRTVAVFEDGKDFIAEDITDDELNALIALHTEKGWVQMDREDIRKTSGV